MENITAAVESWLTLAGTMLSTITKNDILTFFFAASVIGVAIGILRKLKHS